MSSKTSLGYLERLSQKRSKKLIVSFYGFVLNFDLLLLRSESSSHRTMVALLWGGGTALRQN